VRRRYRPDVNARARAAGISGSGFREGEMTIGREGRAAAAAAVGRWEESG